MIFGITMTPAIMMGGGIAIFAVMVFQILQGLRKIKFKGPLHMKVHKWGARVLFVLALLHGVAGMAYFGYIRI
jgi:cytochrome b561